jgi:cephalosporin hydroxylase
MFNAASMKWLPDRLLLHDLVFRLQHFKSDTWELGDDCLLLFKIKGLVDQYERFWATRPGFQSDRIFELGMFDGGSLAFWAETLGPRKIVGVDIQQKADSPYFMRYAKSRADRCDIKSFWGVDQSDQQTLERITQSEFGGELDLVIDDASHMFGLTKRSFEILSPKLRHGGLYVIEDWAWGYWPPFYSLGGAWTAENEPTRLVHELIGVCGSARTDRAGDGTAIVSVETYQGFVIVERGSARLGNDFTLNGYINRRPPRSLVSRLWDKLR